MRLLDIVETRGEMRTAHGTIKGTAKPFFAAANAGLEDTPKITHPTGPHNATVAIGDRFILKLLRKAEPAPHPEIEVPDHVTGPAGFGRVPRAAGKLDYVRRPPRPARNGAKATARAMARMRRRCWRWCTSICRTSGTRGTRRWKKCSASSTA